ncbi:MAG: YVTN family beta-propeller protein [Paraglaciecola sp.]|jgi:YVTN family beta-propeller protein|uniref:YncE family protein n=1 Tax=Polaribacter sp. TaxID=1920175 RepID=UPI003AD9B5F4
MNFKKTVFLIAISGFLFASCTSDNELVLPKGDYDNGILIANEGAFSGGTGTVTFISDDYTVTEEKIYNKVNDENIGTILQSIGFNNDDAYLIANVGNKIAVADRFTMKKITEITGDLNNPRYIAFANGKGFVTNWGDGSNTTDDFVAVIDLTTNTISSKISVAEGPEQIIANGNFLYVSHKGGFGSGSTVSVINASTNTIVKMISVGDIPDELAIDASGNILVSCEGKAETSWNPTEVLGSLVTINTTSNEVSATLDFDSGFHPNAMVLNSGNIYLSTSSSVYKMLESATTIPASAIINTTVYGISVNENKVYITDAKDFQNNGTLKIFDATTNVELKEFTVGLIPGKIYFN